MTLMVAVVNGASVFRSHRCFVDCLGCRLHPPVWLTPSALTVANADAGTNETVGAFRFVLDIEHPRFGWLIWQEAILRDAEPAVQDEER